MEDKNYYIQFLERYAQNLHTSQEHDKFLNWFNRISREQADEVVEAYFVICEKYKLNDQLFPPGQRLIDKIEKRLDQVDQIEEAGDWNAEESTRSGKKLWKFAVAAILILVATGTYYFSRQSEESHPIARSKKNTNDVAPGGNKAILTLADGSEIVLDDAHNGEIANQSGITITKATDGQLIYSIANLAENSDLPAKEVINTITTPRAGQFQVNLPDGTKVWLNSLSSIRFPTVFQGAYRKVEITGEVYFEVARKAQQPFKVKINENTEVEVIGTHFNVNAYTDEASINTTLLEGSVKVNAFSKVQMLSPGQQAQVRSASTGIKLIKQADVMHAMAWKNGAFSFTDADLATVMRQLARWYDVEVDYEGAIPAGEFNGKISRNLTLGQVLKVLTLTRVKYRIENGNKIIIMSD